jgi:hypothetical protein
MLWRGRAGVLVVIFHKINWCGSSIHFNILFWPIVVSLNVRSQMTVSKT